MTAPRTKAGRRLFTDMDPMDMLESHGVTPADITAIEAEAVAAYVADLRAKVEGLHQDAIANALAQDASGNPHGGDVWTGHYIALAAVLRLLDPEGSQG
jgi:hypothetical protein